MRTEYSISSMVAKHTLDTIVDIYLRQSASISSKCCKIRDRQYGYKQLCGPYDSFCSATA